MKWFQLNPLKSRTARRTGILVHTDPEQLLNELSGVNIQTIDDLLTVLPDDLSQEVSLRDVDINPNSENAVSLRNNVGRFEFKHAGIDEPWNEIGSVASLPATYNGIDIDQQDSLTPEMYESFQMEALTGMRLQTKTNSHPQTVCFGPAMPGNQIGNFLLLTWKVSGSIETGIADLVRCPGCSGEIVWGWIFWGMCGQAGTLQLDILKNKESIFNQTDGIKLTGVEDDSGLQTSFSGVAFAGVQSEDRLEVSIENVPDESEDLFVVLGIKLDSAIPMLAVEWKVSSAVRTGTKIDFSRYIGKAGKLSKVYISLEDSGTSGDNFSLDILKNETSLFATLPEITVNSGDDQELWISSFATTDIAAGDLLSLTIETTPDDAENLIVQAYIELEAPLYQECWKVDNFLVVGDTIDLPRIPGGIRYIEWVRISLLDAGSSGDDLTIDLLNNGVSLFESSLPTIAMGSGTNQTVLNTALQGVMLSGSESLLTFSIETAPDDAVGLLCEIGFSCFSPFALTIGDITQVGKVEIGSYLNLTEGSNGQAILDGLTGEGKITTISTATGTLNDSADIYHVTYTATGAVSLTLATTLISQDGRVFCIKDAGGLAATNNIVMTGESGELIDGVASFTLATNYAAQKFYCMSGAVYTL